MMTDNKLSECSDVNDLETTEFNDKTQLYPSYDENEELNVNVYHKKENKKKKYKKFLVIFIVFICLSLAILIGAYLEKLFGFIDFNQNSNNNLINNDEFDIMKEIHIRSKLMREIRSKQGNRTNEEECESRRCCDIRSELTINELPKGLNCTLLTDDECGDMDKFCEWDCDLPSIKQRKNQKFKRHFRRISLFQGQYQLPVYYNDTNSSRDNNQSYEECLQDAKVIVVDDCGIEYDEELDPELAEIFCQSRDGNKAIAGYEGDELLISEYELLGNNGTIDSGEDDDDDDDDRRRLFERELYVLGTDDRNIVSSSAKTDWPWRGALFLGGYNANGVSGQCTAAMISKTWGITAAHCLWSKGDWHTDISVFKYVDECSDIKTDNQYMVDYQIVPTAYIEHNGPLDNFNPTHDVGYFKLKAEPGVGYFGFGYDSSHSSPISLYKIEHPSKDKDLVTWTCKKMWQYCSWNSVTTYKYESNECDGWKGGSGGPVYDFDSNNHRIIYGVYSAGNANVNWAARITSTKFDSMKTRICADEPSRC